MRCVSACNKNVENFPKELINDNYLVPGGVLKFSSFSYPGGMVVVKCFALGYMEKN